MKQSSTCPKCSSTNVVRIKAFKGTSASNMIQLTKWGTKFTFFDRYICTSCGYIEHYIDLEAKGWQKWLEDSLKEDSLDSDFV